MDPVVMILSFALKNPQFAERAKDIVEPGQVDVAKLNASAADFAMQTLNCYHHSARFRGVDIIESPWPGDKKYGADASVVMRIHLMGVSGTAYQMIVAAMAKGHSYRTFVIDENTMISYNRKCPLEYWTSVNEDVQ